MNPQDKSIIYVDTNNFNNLGKAAKDSSRTSTKCAKGLRIIKRLRRQEIINDYDLDFNPDTVSKNDVISLLAARGDENLFYDIGSHDWNGEFLLLSTFDISAVDLFKCVVNDFPDAYIISFLAEWGHKATDLLWQYWHYCGGKIEEGLPEWQQSVSAKAMHEHLQSKMQKFMSAIRAERIDEAALIFKEITQASLKDIFHDLDDEEKLAVLVENLDNIASEIESTQKYTDLCKTAQYRRVKVEKRSAIIGKVLQIVPPCGGCMTGAYPIVDPETLQSAIDNQKDTAKKAQLIELLKELKSLD